MSFILPAAMGLTGLLSGLFGAKSKAKQEDEAYKKALAAWNSNEALRGNRLDALSGVMGNVQGSLQSGAPNYQIDPAIMAKIKMARPFSGADPSQGRGSGLLSGLFGGVGNALSQVYQAQQQESEQKKQDSFLCALLPSLPQCKGIGTGSSTTSPISTDIGGQ